MICPHCGSSNIEEGIRWAEAREGAKVGLLYKKTVFAGVAVAYSDLCRDCGTIIRTFIKENTDKNWNKR